jgi:hypothetical protein
MLQKISANQVYDDTCIKIYDPSQQKLIAVFENFKRAGVKLGVTPAAMQHACARRGRTFSKLLQIEIAPRIGALGETERKQIAHCNKKLTLTQDEKV